MDSAAGTPSTPAEKVQALLSQVQHAQQSDEWFAARRTLLTASEIFSYLPGRRGNPHLYQPDSYTRQFGDQDRSRPYSTKQDLLLRKVAPDVNPFRENAATRHGKRFEAIANRWYEINTGSTLYEFGLIQHPRYDFLGASPDGISAEGVMLETKCPYSRPITGSCPFGYWVQMQIQMQCADLDECDYLECEVKEITENVYLRETSPEREARGEIGCHLGCYFLIRKTCVTRIQRDQQWFAAVLPHLKETASELNRLLNDAAYRQKWIDTIIKKKTNRY
ncbi:hypothetical protein CXG81DRAFT_17319 [Caulochytrium protostelioides]|uniref:Restriction endonuclease-like protein n=1 Tax=Caulochytrium protostelioides TaxID=1555241 RepID=A0A4P9XC87_9FUNG|nr:restriction endonuclease-like protein [Caulochytrium protostelioides]RKP03057.1 hypothetical protein CXG81DRAFT_17319 [Caulochytrium protostelioides]|eukprot:RKP03057.1 hypothetical protein CXG81DRAFT_17319 [Caulochytrium protostelioides]